MTTPSRLPLHLRLCAVCRHTQGRHDPKPPHSCHAEDVRSKCDCSSFVLREAKP